MMYHTWYKGGVFMVTKAQKAATTRFEAKNYDKILLRMRKDTEPTRESVTQCAQAAGMSLNAYIMAAIMEKMEREK